tara:strand:+ start:1461 stop:2078 length:618 start_codon:yes stop_codon:yes gene_type:complete
MAVYDARKLTKLAGNVRDWDSKINSAAANALNRAATKARNDSVSEIFNRTTLSGSYVKERLTVAGRASPSNLRSIVQGVNRATLLSRFDYIKTSAGVKVKVNNRGGFKLIKDSFVVTNLRGSTSTGIAMSNVRAAAYYADAAIGGGSQAVKRKAIKLAIKAKTKPGGIHVLHSRSITQLFESVKVDVSPSVQLFLERTFLDNLGR